MSIYQLTDHKAVGQVGRSLFGDRPAHTGQQSIKDIAATGFGCVPPYRCPVEPRRDGRPPDNSGCVYVSGGSELEPTWLHRLEHVSDAIGQPKFVEVRLSTRQTRQSKFVNPGFFGAADRLRKIVLVSTEQDFRVG